MISSTPARPPLPPGRALVLALVLALLAGGAQAQGEDLQRVYSRISAEEMKAIMQGEGYAVSTDDDGELRWKIEGFHTFIVVYDDQESVQFRAAFGDVETTMDEVNQWNATKRYSTSYLDDEGDPVLNLDLDLAGGVTRARIVDFLKTCKMSFETWVAETIR